MWILTLIYKLLRCMLTSKYFGTFHISFFCYIFSTSFHYGYIMADLKYFKFVKVFFFSLNLNIGYLGEQNIFCIPEKNVYSPVVGWMFDKYQKAKLPGHLHPWQCSVFAACWSLRGILKYTTINTDLSPFSSIRYLPHIWRDPKF